MEKKTSLYGKHVELGAKMIPFAGYLMPVQYTGVNDEHLTVRNAAGIFDVSHMGEFIIKGKQALDLIQYISSNDAGKLYDGKVQYACLPNEKGGIVDDLLIYRLAADEYMLVVNASNIEKDWNWISAHNRFDAEMLNLSEEISLLAVQGPKAANALQPLTDVNLAEMPYYTFQKTVFNGIDNVLISATGYTGAGGFEIYVENKHAASMWEAILYTGSTYGIKPAGLGARDTLRLEMGYCLYGNDIDEQTSPLEAGLGWVTKFSKKFIHSAHLKKQKEQGIQRKLIGFKMIERGIPRHGYAIVDENGNQIGVVTSGTMAPSLKEAIGLGYVPAAISSPGAPLLISVRNKTLKARIVSLPFYKKP